MMRGAVLFITMLTFQYARMAGAFVPSRKRYASKPIIMRTMRLFASADTRKEKEFVAHQKSVSSPDGTKKSLQDHLEHQRKVFDEQSDYFASGQTIPESLVPVYKHLASQIVETSSTMSAESKQKEEEAEEQPKSLRILEVACGTGALFSFILDRASKDVQVDITGVDLAPKMVAAAQAHADFILASGQEGSTIQVFESDIMDYTITKNIDDDDDEGKKFDIVILNACFGNFWNSTAVLQHIGYNLVKEDGGHIIISHPLGAEFVAKLHEEDSATVPHLLPTTESEWAVRTRYLPLQLEKLDTYFQDEPYYFCSLKRVRHIALPQVLRLRGRVTSGFGRGGKKLGFPTANLSPEDMRPALENVNTGVYFGWAVIEDRQDQSYKAVVNVGFSPTFEGKENAEKIVEAHLIMEAGQEVADFYDEIMRLQLIGFLRPEIKFPSFPDLIAQITADRDEARESLELEPYSTLAKDGFLVDAEGEWVGYSGGDKDNSWEFQDTDEAIESLS